MTSNRQDEIRFFKIILDTTLQRGNMMIPKRFTAEHGGNLSNPVILKSPDGIEWEMHCTKDDSGGFWFEEGWKQFATHYSLCHGHVVVFKYRKICGNLEVLHILDGGTAFEINYPSNSPQIQVLEEATPTSCPPTLKILTMSSHSLQENKGGACFSVRLKPSYVNGYLTIPSTFVKKYLKEKRREDILLQVSDGRTWPAKLWFGKSSTKFCSGWKKFASDNHLKSGDVCVFELIKSRGPCFNVRIVKISEETPSCSPVQADGITDLKSITTLPIEAMREAKKFSTENPFFEITLKANRRGDFRPRLPLKFVREYFHGKQIVRLQFRNKSWGVNLAGQVPTKLSRGWYKFANECKLQHGDICVFELINKVDLVFDVHVIKGHS